jgi:heme/copper-type cytochrome/quinol oxidase subunit 2
MISIGDHEDGIGDDCIDNGEEVILVMIILVMIVMVMTVLVIVKFLL